MQPYTSEGNKTLRTYEMEEVSHGSGYIDLLVGAVLAGLGGQRVVVADRAGQVVHQTQLSLH